MAQNAINSSEFQYTPLPSRTSIRLIEMQTSSAGGIAFSLLTTDISEPPLYDALSYTWGSPWSPCLESHSEDPSEFYAATFPAICNGQNVMLRPSLRDAMQMLQAVSFASLGKTKQRYIWIDALSIDQTNLKERAEQVGLMRSIYQKAELVISWLGPEDETTKEAFVVIDRLSSIAFIPESVTEVMVPIEAYSVVDAADFVNPESYRSKLGIEPFTQQNWLAWLVFLHRPYFKRAWVVQEVTVAKSIVAVCGNRQFDWQKLSKAMYFLVHTKWTSILHTQYFRVRIAQNTPSIYSKMLSQNLDPGGGAFQLCHSHAATKRAGKSWTFESLLQNHRYCEASDARDMIYALQGLARQESKPFTTHKHLMAPDYTISVSSLYIRTARIMIQSFNDLRFLAHREPREQRGVIGLPSWVPDYSVPLKVDPLAKRGPNCNWCAGGNLTMKIDSRSLTDAFLDVHGCCIGTIEAISDDPTDNADWTGMWRSICEVTQGIEAYFTLDHEP
jgi:hypothetical protein